MKLFKIWQAVNNDYDTFDSAVVVAPSEEEAIRIHPSCEEPFIKCDCREGIEGEFHYCDWAFSVEDVKVEYLGEAKPGLPKGVVVASFNAG